MNLQPLLICSLLAGFLLSSCDIWSTDAPIVYQPAQVPVGTLTLGVWLPAGLNQYRFDANDRQQLLDLGINQLEWLQRDSVGAPTPEATAMDFSSINGLHMPIYYEPPNASPYDKLHNWATRTEINASFTDSLRLIVRQLKSHWENHAAFQGYLIGHEDYNSAVYPALAQTINVLHQEDPLRPVYTVGNLNDYHLQEQFLDAFFQPAGTTNIFQHEHYIFHADVPYAGRHLQRRLDDLTSGYDQVAHQTHHRNGRWHGIIQVHEETRSQLFLRAPTATEIHLQAGLALTRGASGIIYFLYSSGLEEVRNNQDEIIEYRTYTGLVNDTGQPNSRYIAVQQLNQKLKELSKVLENLYYYGAFSSRNRRQNPVVTKASSDLAFGLFGDQTQITHMLIVNRQPTEQRNTIIQFKATTVSDALTKKNIPIDQGEIQIALKPGELKLLSLTGLPSTSID